MMEIRRRKKLESLKATMKACDRVITNSPQSNVSMVISQRLM